MNGPNLIHLQNDLAADRPLYELTVFRKDSKLFASMLLELKPDADKAESPTIGEKRERERGMPVRTLPHGVFFNGPSDHYLLEARSVPTLPAQAKKP